MIKHKWCDRCNGYMGHEARRSGEPLCYCRACWKRMGEEATLCLAIFLAGAAVAIGLIARAGGW